MFWLQSIPYDVKIGPQLFISPDFFLHCPKELSYGYLRFEGNGKIPLGRQGKGREKGRVRIEK